MKSNYHFTGCAVLLLCSFARPGLADQVVFSELMYHPPAGLPEFIEVYNSTATPLDMAEWKLREGLATVRSGSGRISAQWWYQPSLEFYRQAWGLRFAPIERVEGDSAPLNGYDYYFLQNPPADQLSANHLRPVYRDQDSGLMVAVPEFRRP